MFRVTELEERIPSSGHVRPLAARHALPGPCPCDVAEAAKCRRRAVSVAVDPRGHSVSTSDVIFPKMADRYQPKPKFGENFRPNTDR